jgi:predicted peptidase
MFSSFVLSPQYGTEPAESDCDIGDDVAAFLGFAAEHYEIDTSRVYLTGMSCGAIGVWDYIAAHSDEAVAAAVPISGHAEWALEKAGCEALAAVPVWAFHGAQDDVVPTIHIGGPMDKIRAARAPSR